MKRGRKLSRERLTPLTPQERAALENEIFNSHALAAQANRKMAEATQQLVLRAGRNGGGDESGLPQGVAEFLRKIVDGLEQFASVVEEGAVLLKEELTEGGDRRRQWAEAPPPKANGHGRPRRRPPSENRTDQKAARRELVVPYVLTLLDTLGPVGNRYIVDHMIRTTEFRKKMKEVGAKPAPQGISQILMSDPRVIYDSKARVWMRKAGAEAEAKKEDAG